MVIGWFVIGKLFLIVVILVVVNCVVSYLWCLFVWGIWYGYCMLNFVDGICKVCEKCDVCMFDYDFFDVVL